MEALDRPAGARHPRPGTPSHCLDGTVPYVRPRSDASAGGQYWPRSKVASTGREARSPVLAAEQYWRPVLACSAASAGPDGAAWLAQAFQTGLVTVRVAPLSPGGRPHDSPCGTSEGALAWSVSGVGGHGETLWKGGKAYRAFQALKARRLPSSS